MGRLYSFGRQDSKMSVPVHTPPSPPEIKYENDISLGPYYAQYWNLVGGTVEHDGMPIPANGSYISPYGSAQESFFPTIQDPELPTGLEEVPWNGVNACGDPLFTHSRSTSYGPVADAAHPYNTPPMDGCSWGQYPSSDPVMQMQSLPALENLANQILTMLMSGSAQDFVSTVAAPDNEGSGQAYAAVEALFEQQKRIFSRGRLFLDAASVSVGSPAFPRVARKVNLATFVTCVFRGQDVPFLELDEAFLDIFMPTGSRLLKGEGALYLELKTQAFIALVMNGAANRDDVLDKLFPRDLQLAILRRRPEPTHLAPSEADFISRVNTRRQYLNAGAQSVESLAQLPQKYIWKDFLDEVASCVKRVLEGLESGKVRPRSLPRYVLTTAKGPPRRPHGRRPHRQGHPRRPRRHLRPRRPPPAPPAPRPPPVHQPQLARRRAVGHLVPVPRRAHAQLRRLAHVARVRAVLPQRHRVHGLADEPRRRRPPPPAEHRAAALPALDVAPERGGRRRRHQADGVGRRPRRRRRRRAGRAAAERAVAAPPVDAGRGEGAARRPRARQGPALVARSSRCTAPAAASARCSRTATRSSSRTRPAT